MTVSIIKETSQPLTIIYPNSSKSFTVLALVKVGSRHEQEHLGGISHFVEHMLFKSTKKRKTSREIALDIEMTGGISNAFTSYEYTGYYIKSSPEHISSGVDILADIVKNTVFKKDEFEKEKGVILEEIKMYHDRPTSKVVTNWKKAYYGDHPLGRDIAGTLDIIKQLKVEDLEQFYKKYYTNDNIIVTVAGNVEDVERLKLDTKIYFKETKKESESEEADRIYEDSYKAQIVSEYKDLEQAHIYLGFSVSPGSYETHLYTDILNTVISEGFGSRLFQKLREEMGLAYYLYSDFSLFEDSGRLNLGFGTDLNKLEEVIEAVVNEINLLIKEGITEKELERAKNYHVSRLLFEMENSDELAGWVGMNYLEYGKVITVEEHVNNLRILTVEGINEYIKREFSKKNVLVSVLGKIEKDLNNKFNLKLD